MKNYFLIIIAIFAFACRQKSSTIIKVKNLDFDKAMSYLNENTDSAFYYFNRVATNNTDSLTTAESFNYMAVIQSDAGDYFGAQESATRSLKFLNEKKQTDHSCIGSNYNELGVSSNNLHNYSQAVNYFSKALRFTNSAFFSTIIQNNMALSYQKLKNYDKAKQIYQTILSRTSKKEIEYARFLSNLEKTKWLQNTKYIAAPRLLFALEVRKNNNDKWGQNASYAHLSDYYNKTNPDSALIFANKMYETAQNLNSPDDQLEALQKLIKLSPANTAKKYFEIYASLSDSLQTARNAAKNQFALIRYETEKHKADNLTLQKENSEKKYQIIIISSAALFILLGGIFWYRKRKRDIEIQSQKAITDSKLKTSKKVHDVVANGLYRVMTEIENQQDLDRNHVLDKIEDLYEKSRDISYEKPTQAKQPFHEVLSEILTSFATENRKVLIAGNDAELWLKVSEQTKYELEHIIQELMVNMKKHSQASNVVMRFESNGEQIKIYYADNGVGMPKDNEFNNGLRNTGNRIEEINGAIIFDTEVEKGLKIQISFPIS